MPLVPSPPRRAVAQECHARRNHCPAATDAATQVSAAALDASTMTMADATLPPWTTITNAMIRTNSDSSMTLPQHVMHRLRAAIEDAMLVTKDLRSHVIPPSASTAIGTLRGGGGNGEASSSSDTSASLSASSRSTMPMDTSGGGEPPFTTRSTPDTSTKIAAQCVADATADIAAALSVAKTLLDELHHTGAQIIEKTATVANQASASIHQQNSTNGLKETSLTLLPVTSEHTCTSESISTATWHLGGDDGQSPTGQLAVPQKTTTVLEQREDETGHKVINDYVILDDLGKGACGSVKLAFNVTRNVSVAVKVVRRGRSGALGVGRTAGLKEEALRREIALMKRLSHPNIVQLYEVIDDPTAMKLYLVMQYADQGAVGAVQADRTCTTLPLFDVVDVAYQCASGLKYLHNLDILHRDIKPENLFRTSEGRVMIGDFGISGLVEDAADMPAGVGTPLFMAPELHAAAEGARTGAEEGPHRQGSPSAPSVGTAAADMWALGVTLFALTSGRLPFPSTAAIQDPVAVAALPAMHCDCACAPDTPCSALLVAWRTCVEAMLARDPAHRPSANALRKVSKALRNAPCEICCVCAPSSSPGVGSDGVGGSCMPTTELQLPRCDPKETEGSVASASLPNGTLSSGTRVSNVALTSSRCASGGLHESGSGARDEDHVGASCSATAAGDFSDTCASHVVLATSLWRGLAADVAPTTHRSPRYNGRTMGRMTASRTVSEQECSEAITSLSAIGESSSMSMLEVSATVGALHTTRMRPPSQAARLRR